MSRVLSTLGLAALAAAGCSKKNPDGLPPASEWGASGAAAAPTADLPPPAPPPGMRGKSGGNPHAGMAGGPDNPHGGDPGGDPSDPHAGLDMSGNPHAGGGTDVTKLGLAAPDPNRKLDPNHRVAGTLTVDAKAKDKLKAGTAVFLTVKKAGPDGAPVGPPLAVDKLTWLDGGTPFELTDAQAMVAGTELSGDVVVSARYDQDSDALSKQPGDVTGLARVKIPADHVRLVLDTVLP